MNTTPGTDHSWCDERGLKRYLSGLASSEEASMIEARLGENADFAEQVAALEDEMLRDYALGEPADEWRDALHATVEQSPERRNRVEQMRALIAALRSPEQSGTAPRAAATAWRGWAVAASLLVAAAGAWYALRAIPPVADLATAGRPRVVSLTLVPTMTRSSESLENVLSLGQPGTPTVRLVGTMPVDSPLDPDLPYAVERVGAGPVTLASRPRFERTSTEQLRFEWSIGGERLPPGDYILTIGSASHRQGILGAWAFSVLP